MTLQGTERNRPRGSFFSYKPRDDPTRLGSMFLQAQSCPALLTPKVQAFLFYPPIYVCFYLEPGVLQALQRGGLCVLRAGVWIPVRLWKHAAERVSHGL